jgi:ribulose-5-phosphate 4-epimerase/fuculose-1-phosphate aldolase
MVDTAFQGVGTRRADARTIACSAQPDDPLLRRFVDGLQRATRAAGYDTLPSPVPEVNVVLHPVALDSARPFRRKAAPTFVIAIAALDAPADEPLLAGYPLLVRALANLCVLVSTTQDGLCVQFVTLEQGRYSIGPGLADDELFTRVFERLEPLASSRLVITNRFETDLPESLWYGDAQTESMLRAGRALDALNLLPNPFPVEDLLSPRDLRHVKLLYGIGGLSYGNLSARYRGELHGVPDSDGPVYWMSASGGDKSDLRVVGEDVLLVRGYEPDGDTIVLSVPPNVKPRRVSVDAIEHFMIYREHPSVGAIMHVHGWIEGTPSTEVNYPCGTTQLASSVADLVRRQADPSRAVVGLRNHGLTITGHSLDEIFERVGSRIVPNVPMS